MYKLGLVFPLALFVACSNTVKLGDDTGVPDTDSPDVGIEDADGDGVPAEEDCDDNDASTYPDADEVEDGVDNDCDGYTDEVEVCEGAYADIQGAIDDAPDGGVILICAGTYAERLEVSGRELHLIGVDGAADTIIDAEGGGSALVVERDAELIVEGLTFTGGQAASGGGISCDDADLDLVEVVLSGNSAEVNGGGLASEGCRLDIQASEISGNSATQYGGGLYVNDGRGDLAGSLIEGNTADQGGGLFSYGADLDVTGNEVRGNEALTVDEESWGAGGGGGGLWMATNSEVRGNLITENHAAYNGGGVFFYRNSPTFADNEVVANTNGEDGAGAYLNNAGGEIIGNLFDANEAGDDGGGLRLYFGTCTIEDNVFTNNTANDDGGGAKLSHSQHTFRRNHLEGNHTGDAGGGLELDNDSSHVSECTFVGNTANRGAGLHNWRTERRFTIESSVFEGNEAGDCGGGLSFDNSPYRITLHDLLLDGNEADDGAAICTDLVYRDPEDVGGQEDYYQATVLEIRNVVMTDNRAADDGGGIYVKAGRVDAQNLVMVDNRGPGASAAVAKEDGQLSLSNAILSENDGGPALYIEDDGIIEVRYSDLHGHDDNASGMDDPVGTNGNIDDDPDLNSDWTLGNSSPCIDAGDPSITDPDGSRSDMGYHGGPGAP